MRMNCLVSAKRTLAVLVSVKKCMRPTTVEQGAAAEKGGTICLWFGMQCHTESACPYCDNP